MTNREYAKDYAFRDRCVVAGVEPTRRQASKFRRKRGMVYAVTAHLTLTDIESRIRAAR